MLELQQTETFRRWRQKLKDARTRVIIASRLDRLAFGHTGDSKSVGDSVWELRINYGPGFRIYFQRRGTTVVVLLCGGDKSTQIKDIETAKSLAKTWSSQDDRSSDPV